MVAQVLFAVQPAYYSSMSPSAQRTHDLCRRYFSQVSNVLVTFNSASSSTVCAVATSGRCSWPGSVVVVRDATVERLQLLSLLPPETEMIMKTSGYLVTVMLRDIIKRPANENAAVCKQRLSFPSGNTTCLSMSLLSARNRPGGGAKCPSGSSDGVGRVVTGSGNKED